MSTRYMVYNVRETTYGASSGLMVKYKNGIADEVLDISTNETHYVWDAYINPKEILHKQQDQIEQRLEDRLEGMADEFCNPFWSMQETDAKEWQRTKIEQNREDYRYEHYEEEDIPETPRRKVQKKSRRNSRQEYMNARNNEGR